MEPVTRPFALELVARCEDRDVGEVMGSRKAKTYRKMLARSGIPAKSLQFLPEMKAQQGYRLGRESSKVFRRIQESYHHKPRRKRESLEDSSSEEEGEQEREDQEGEDHDQENEDEQSDSGQDSSSEDVSSSDGEEEEEEEEGDSDAQDRAQNYDKFVVLSEELEKSNTPHPTAALLPRDQVAWLMCRDRAAFKPVDIEGFPDAALVEGDIGTESVETAIPGFCEKKQGVSKSRHGEEFFNYKGRWEAGVIQGLGLEVFSDGGTYMGSWADFLPNGKGTAVYPDGASYTGEWKNGQKHGYGRDSRPEGSEYIGNFENGQRTGHGKLIFPSNLEYNGDFCNGVFHGRGTMVNSEGYSYSGCWVNGRISGTGALTEPDGTRTAKTWKPPRTFHEVVFLAESTKEKLARKRTKLRQRLYAALDDMNLQRQVRKVRDNIKQAEIDRKEAERAELDRLRKERREQLLKAKQDALDGVGWEEPPPDGSQALEEGNEQEQEEETADS